MVLWTLGKQGHLNVKGGAWRWEDPTLGMVKHSSICSQNYFSLPNIQAQLPSCTWLAKTLLEFWFLSQATCYVELQSGSLADLKSIRKLRIQLWKLFHGAALLYANPSSQSGSCFSSSKWSPAVKKLLRGILRSCGSPGIPLCLQSIRISPDVHWLLLSDLLPQTGNAWYLECFNYKYYHAACYSKPEH